MKIIMKIIIFLFFIMNTLYIYSSYYSVKKISQKFFDFNKILVEKYKKNKKPIIIGGSLLASLLVVKLYFHYRNKNSSSEDTNEDKSKQISEKISKLFDKDMLLSEDIINDLEIDMFQKKNEIEAEINTIKKSNLNLANNLQKELDEKINELLSEKEKLKNNKSFFGGGSHTKVQISPEEQANYTEISEKIKNLFDQNIMVSLDIVNAAEIKIFEKKDEIDIEIDNMRYSNSDLADKLNLELEQKIRKFLSIKNSIHQDSYSNIEKRIKNLYEERSLLTIGMVDQVLSNIINNESPSIKLEIEKFKKEYQDPLLAKELERILDSKIKKLDEIKIMLAAGPWAEVIKERNAKKKNSKSNKFAFKNNTT